MNNESNKMMKKRIITTLLILIVCIGAYFAYDFYNKNSNANVAVKEETPKPDTVENKLPPGPKARTDLTVDQKAVIEASILRMSTVMESNDAKKIRAFMTSLYPSKADQDAIVKIPDAQLLQSAKYFKDFNLSASLSSALSSLPNSAWAISSSTATITQDSADGHKAVFTATKVNGKWQ